MYSGIGTSLIRAIPASATAMLVYKVIVYLLNSRLDVNSRVLISCRRGPLTNTAIRVAKEAY